MSESISRVPLLSESNQARQVADSASLTIQNLAAAYGALQAGKLPTSDQLVSFVQAALRSSVLQPEIGGMVARKAGGARLSKRGKAVVVDTRKVLEAVNRLILEKNDDDKVRFFSLFELAARPSRLNLQRDGFSDSTFHLASESSRH